MMKQQALNSKMVAAAFTALLFLILGIGACDNTDSSIKTIPFSQVIADVKAGKIVELRYVVDDASIISVCYDLQCTNRQYSKKPSAETVAALLTSAGVKPEQMPTIRVYATAVSKPVPTPVGERIFISQMIDDIKTGKISQIIYNEDSDYLKVCYGTDLACKVYKISVKESSTESLTSYLLKAGVPQDEMPIITVMPPSIWR